MITVKLSSYSTEEAKKLYDLFSFMETDFRTDMKCYPSTSNECDTCKNRHICYDLAQVLSFLKTEQKYGFPHTYGKK